MLVLVIGGVSDLWKINVRIWKLQKRRSGLEWLNVYDLFFELHNCIYLVKVDYSECTHEHASRGEHAERGSARIGDVWAIVNHVNHVNHVQDFGAVFSKCRGDFWLKCTITC